MVIWYFSLIDGNLIDPVMVRAPVAPMEEGAGCATQPVNVQDRNPTTLFSPAFSSSISKRASRVSESQLDSGSNIDSLIKGSNPVPGKENKKVGYGSYSQPAMVSKI